MENQYHIREQEWDSQLRSIREAPTLRDLNVILTKSMAQQAIHSLLKRDEDLHSTIDAITRLSNGNEENAPLLAGAALGRLASVLGSSQSSTVIAAIQRLLVHRPGAIENLQGK